MYHLKDVARCKILIILILSSIQFIDGFSLISNSNITTNSTTDTILECSDVIRVTCIPDAPSNPISWQEVVSGNTLSDCIAPSTCSPVSPTAYPHYTFSISGTGTDFYLDISQVKISDDSLQYSCGDTTTTRTLDIKVKEFFTDSSVVTVTNTNSNEVTVDFETNCVNIPSSIMELSWEYKDGDTVMSLTPVRQNIVVSTTCAASGDCITATSQKHTLRVFLESSSSCVSKQIRAKITVSGYTGVPAVYTGYTAACIAGPSPGPSPDCKCDCCIHKIMWIVVSIVFSLPSLGWTYFVLKDDRRKQWLQNKFGEQAHLCMIGWVVLNLVYSIIAAILFFVLVCKNDCCEEVCACICNCWPIYIIIGYVLKAGDVIVDIIGGIAFKEGTNKRNVDRKYSHEASNMEVSENAASL